MLESDLLSNQIVPKFGKVQVFLHSVPPPFVEYLSGFGLIRISYTKFLFLKMENVDWLSKSMRFAGRPYTRDCDRFTCACVNWYVICKLFDPVSSPVKSGIMSVVLSSLLLSSSFWFPPV